MDNKLTTELERPSLESKIKQNQQLIEALMKVNATQAKQIEDLTAQIAEKDFHNWRELCKWIDERV